MADDDPQITTYGYEQPGDKYFDWNSYHGIGDRDNILTANSDHQSVALTKSERQALFGTTGTSTGKAFDYQGKTFYDDDTAPEGNRRIDIYAPAGALTALKEVGYGSANFKIAPIGQQPTGGDIDYNPVTEEMEEPPKKENTQSPLEVYRKNFPQFSDKSDDQVLEDMRKNLAPGVSQDKFNALAKSSNGWQAIQAASQNLTPIQEYKKLYPQFANKSDDEITKAAYDYFVSQKEINPDLTDIEDFRQVMSPKSGIANTVFQAWRGAARQASAFLHQGNADLYGFPSNAANLFYDTLDALGKMPLYPTGPQDYGTQLKTFANAADDWISQNVSKPFEDFGKQVFGWLNNNAQQQSVQAVTDLTRAGQVKGVAGTAGRLVGGTAVGLATSLPFMEAIGGTSKAAALVASYFMGSSKYGEAVQAHHDNAWLEGIQEMGTAGMFRYLVNSPAGRLKTAFVNFAMNSGEDEAARMLRGEKTDWANFAMRGGVDLLVGAITAKAQEKGPFRTDISLGEFTPEAPPPRVEPIVPKIFSAAQARAEERRIMTGRLTEAEVAREEGAPGWQRQRERDILAGRQPKERGYQPAPNLVPSEPLYDPHIENNGGIPPAAAEEVTKAVHAQRNGDTEKARDHTDKALSYLPKKDQRDIAQKTIDAVKSKTTGKVNDKVNEAYFGVKPIVQKQAGDPIRQAYNDLKAQQGGLSAVSIGALAKKAGVPVSQVHDYLRQEAREGRADLHPTTVLELSEEEKSGTMPNVRKGGEPYTKTTLRPRVSRGEAGAVLNPATLVHEFFTQTWPGIKEKIPKFRSQQWIEIYHPELIGRGEEAAAVSKYHTVEAQGSELLRNWMARTLHVDAALSGTEPVMRRKSEFDKHLDGKLKEMLIAHEEGRSTGNAVADWIFKFHDMAYKGMQVLENALGIEYDPKDIYIYHALKKEDQKKFLEWYDGLVNSDPSFSKRRKLPTLRQVFAQKFELASNNPEELFQMRLFQHNQALRKIRTLDSLEEMGMAYNTKTEGLSEETKQWDKARSPNGKNYYLEPGAAAVLKNAWDRDSLYNIKLIGPVFKGINILKGMGSTILGWSLVHPGHIERISLVNLGGTWAKDIFVKRRSPTRAQDMQGLWDSITRATGASGNTLLDWFHGKVGRDQLSTEDVRDMEHLKYMGLNFNLSEERRMQLEWAKHLAEMVPDWKTGVRRIDQAVQLGTKVLSLEWVNKFIFGEIIPRQKMFAALLSRDQLLRDHPEYDLPQNQSQFHAELSRKGREIEAKFGEMNLANLHWRRTAKELGTSMLLSLGWQLSAIRIYAGGIKDLTDNVAHFRDVMRNANDPKKRDFFTDRLVFATNYTLGYMAMNAVISYFNGWNKGKEFESRDLWFPIIGENEAGSQQRWKRVSPVEFPREFASVYQHIKNQGGGLHGIPYGISDYLTNKIQPVLASLKQAFIDQKNYFGQEIGDPLDQDHEWIWNKVGYIVENSTIPITFKQALQDKPGEPGGLQNVFTADTLWAVMGYPRAPVWTGRSDIENLIYATHWRMNPSEKTAQGVAISSAYEEYREALGAQDQGRINAAVDKLQSLGKSPKSIAMVRRSAEKGITGAQYFFSQFDPLIQQKLLSRMTPEERANYERFAKKQ